MPSKASGERGIRRPHRSSARPRMRKALLCGAAAITVVGVVTACAPRSSSGGAAGASTITYSWWGGSDRTKLQDGVVAMFEKAHPQTAIKRTTTSGTDTFVTRLAVQVSGGNLPDMFQNQDRFLRQFAGATRPLDSYIKDGTIDVSDVPAEVLAAGKYDGKQLMVGTSFSFRGLFYDKKMFANAGVSAPGLNTTWDQLATKLTKVAGSKLPSGTYASANLCGNDSAFYTYLRGRGDQIYSGDALGFGKPAIEAWFSYWKKLQSAKAVPPPDLQQEQQGTTTEDTMIAKKMVGLDVIPANQYTTIKGLNPNISMTSMPRGPRGSGNFLIVSGQSISSKSSDPKAAGQFINFFLNDVKAQKSYRADNGIPASNNARVAVAKMLHDPQFALYDQIKSDLGPMPPQPPGGAAVIQALGQSCDAVAFGKSDVGQAADQYLAAAKSALKQ